MVDEQQKIKETPAETEVAKDTALDYFYRIRFRANGQEFTALSTLEDLKRDDVVMVRGEFGLEPACVISTAPACRESDVIRRASYEISRRAAHEECNRYSNIPVEEAVAFTTCKELILRHTLQMRLVRVERFLTAVR